MSDYIIYNGELKHYGVKGMKWGVRRYRNFNGSYTQAGVKRFDKSVSEYEKSKANYKKAKAEKSPYKNNAKIKMKKDYKQVKKDYKHLKQDKLADKGKERYANGYRITNNAGTKLIRAGATTTLISGFLYANNILDKKQASTLTSIALGTSAVGTGMSIVNQYKDRQLRAYYSHTSKY